MARLGDVEFDAVKDENPTDSVEATDHNVEEGADITDHVRANPYSITITGVFTKEGSDKKLAKLRKYQRDKELLTYVGRNIAHKVLILSIDRNHNADNMFGFAFDIKLRRLRIATSKRVDIQVKHPKTSKKKKGKKKNKQTKAAKTANRKTRTKSRKPVKKGKQQPKRKPKPPNPSGRNRPQVAIDTYGGGW